jgi:hypothetical protein
MHKYSILLLSLFLSLCASLLHAEPETRIFTLRGDAQQLQQTITNLYGDQAKLSLIDKQLAVRAEPAVLDQIGKLLGDVDSAPILLSVSLSSTPQDGGNSISTRSNNDISGMQTENGKTFTLSKARTRQQPVFGSWYQVGIEEVPVDEETLIITPELSLGEVRVQLSYRMKKDSRLASGNQTVVGKPGTWISLIGDSNIQKSNGSHTISTGSRNLSSQGNSTLWIKVDEVE